MVRDYGLIHDASELRRLIAEHPDLPIVVLADEDSAVDWSAWTYCSDVSACIDEILDMRTPYDQDGEKIFTNRGEFLDAIIETFEDDPRYADLEFPEFEAAVKAEKEKYDGGWVTVIAIYATN